MVVTNISKYKIWTYEQIKANKVMFDEVFAYLKMYGTHSMAYSILQPRMNYFILEDIGIVAYSKLGKNGKTRYVLGDPLVSRQYAELLLKEFLSVFPEAQFVQVSERIAKILNRITGFYATPMGIETLIELTKFTINGAEKRKFRNNLRKCRENIQVFEESEVNLSKETQLNISRNWLDKIKKGKNELNFLARPLITEKEEDVRIFYAFYKKQTIGFLSLNPIYKDNQIIGYFTDFTRVLSGLPRGVSDSLFYISLKKLKREGISFISLGLSPFANLDSDFLFLEDKMTKIILKRIYKNLNFLYSFQGLASHKKQFLGKEEIVYYCHKNKLPLLDIYKLFKICNVF